MAMPPPAACMRWMKCSRRVLNEAWSRRRWSVTVFMERLWHPVRLRSGVPYRTVEFGEACGRADVDPSARVCASADASRSDGLTQQGGKTGGTIAFEVGKQRRMISANAGKRQPRPVVPDALIVQREITVRMVRRIGDEHQMSEVAVFAQMLGGAADNAEIHLAKYVCIDDDEGRCAKQWQSLADAAGGFQGGGLGRIADRYAQVRTVAERRDDQMAEMSMIDHDVVDAGGAQALDLPYDQRLSCDFKQRFRQRVGEWAHALAASGGKNHGAGRGFQKV